MAYARTDANIPLRDVSMLVSDENVWANLQGTGRPNKIEYDLRNRREWKPFFHEKFPPENKWVTTVNDAKLKYEPTDDSFVRFLEAEVSDRLQREIRRWRSNKSFTRFHKPIGRKLRQLLEQLEKYKCGDEAFSEANHLTALKNELMTHQMFGFPLNLTFTDMDSIVQLVKNTQIHNNEHEHVQFALAVYVKKYVNSICSVWIYVASIVANRDM